MDEPRKFALQFLVAKHAFLTDQESGSLLKARTTADGKANGVHHVVPVYERLSGRDVARKQVALQAPLVDPLHLVRKRRHLAVLVVDARDAKHRVRDAAVVTLNNPFSL